MRRPSPEPRASEPRARRQRPPRPQGRCRSRRGRSGDRVAWDRVGRAPPRRPPLKGQSTSRRPVAARVRAGDGLGRTLAGPVPRPRPRGAGRRRTPRRRAPAINAERARGRSGRGDGASGRRPAGVGGRRGRPDDGGAHGGDLPEVVDASRFPHDDPAVALEFVVAGDVPHSLGRPRLPESWSAPSVPPEPARRSEVVSAAFSCHECPAPRPDRSPGSAPGRSAARPVLGGLHHVYERAA
jgi:hypothetical protein